MSTLIGTSRAVVVGGGSGPGPTTPPPPTAAPQCWTNPDYFDTFQRSPALSQETGCASSGYPWIESQPPVTGESLLTVDSVWYLQLVAPNPVTDNGCEVTTTTGNLPFDPIACTVTFQLTQTLAITSDVDNIDTFVFTVSRSDETQGYFEYATFTVYSESRQTHTPLGEYTDLQIDYHDRNSVHTTTNTELSGLLTTGLGATVVITLNSTQLSLSVAGNTISLPWTPFAADSSNVYALLTMEADLSNGEGPFDPTGSPNTAFTTTVGPIQINAPLGNCAGDRSVALGPIDDFQRTVAPSSSAGFGDASSGNTWSNAGPAGGVTPATHNISVSGGSGIIDIVGGGGVGENDWFTSLRIPTGWQQSGDARNVTYRWYWTLTAASAITTTSVYFGLHGANSSTSYASWSLPSGVDGADEYGATIYIIRNTGNRSIEGRLGTTSGVDLDTVTISELVVGTAYVAEIAMVEGSPAEYRHWLASAARPSAPTLTVPSGGSMAANLGPFDGVSIGLGVSNSGTPSATLAIAQVNVDFTAAPYSYTFPQC